MLVTGLPGWWAVLAPPDPDLSLPSVVTEMALAADESGSKKR